MLSRDQQELLDTAKWAVDLLKLYDKRLIALGQRSELVYSDTHKTGMQTADKVLAQWDWKASKCLGD